MGSVGIAEPGREPEVSVLQQLMGRAEPQNPFGETKKASSTHTFRFEVKMDAAEVSVVSFEDLVLQQEERRESHGSASSRPSLPHSVDQDSNQEGSCYDSDDSFLDDQELVEELEPSRMKSKIDGFFINTGSIASEIDPSYEGNQDRNRLTPHGTHLVSGKPKKNKSNDESKQKEAAERSLVDGAALSASPKRSIAADGTPGVVEATLSLASDASQSAPNFASPRPRPGGEGGRPQKKAKSIVLPKIHDGVQCRVSIVSLRSHRKRARGSYWARTAGLIGERAPPVYAAGGKPG
jgi:hypothetical protein